MPKIIIMKCVTSFLPSFFCHVQVKKYVIKQYLRAQSDFEFGRIPVLKVEQIEQPYQTLKTGFICRSSCKLLDQEDDICLFSIKYLY